jgi:hypothetical protein
LWRGPAYADFADEPWAISERTRLAELRLSLIERQAEARLALGLAAQAVPDLQPHTIGHPWRAGDVRAVTGDVRAITDDVWAVTAAAYQRTSPPLTRTRLESAATLAGSLALSGGNGLAAAMRQRLAASEAAEKLGDPGLTARVIGNFDVPAIWPRSDDPATAGRIVAAAERTLAVLPADRDAQRARLLATIALESRGSSAARPGEAAAEAGAIARRLGDPALLAFALNSVWMQAFSRTGLAARRDAIGAEIVALATRHGLVNFEILGRLIRVQALSGHGDFAGADAHAQTLDRLGEVHERPLVTVFTGWYRAMRTTAATPNAPGATERYRQAATLLDGAGMPGVQHGLLALALLCLRVWRREPADFSDDTRWGPYHSWALPWLLLARDARDAAGEALRRCLAPPPGLLAEALWCLTARAAVILADHTIAARAHDALQPAADEIASAASGMLTAGPVSDYLCELRPSLLAGSPLTERAHRASTFPAVTREPAAASVVPIPAAAATGPTASSPSGPSTKDPRAS